MQPSCTSSGLDAINTAPLVCDVYCPLASTGQWRLFHCVLQSPSMISMPSSMAVSLQRPLPWAAGSRPLLHSPMVVEPCPYAFQSGPEATSCNIRAYTQVSAARQGSQTTQALTTATQAGCKQLHSCWLAGTTLPSGSYPVSPGWLLTKKHSLPPVNWRWVEEGDGYVRHCSPPSPG